MDWLRLVGFCLLAASMVMVLRQMSAQAAGLLTAAFGVLIVGAVLPQVQAYVLQVKSFMDSMALDGQYYAVMLRAMGIMLITQISSQVCEDMGAPVVAERAQMCGRIALLGIAVPVFMELTQMAVDVLR